METSQFQKAPVLRVLFGSVVMVEWVGQLQDEPV